MPELPERSTTAPADYMVSVCTIVENDVDIVESLVRELSALLADTYKYHEIVLIDNCSSDGTDARVAALQLDVPGVRLIRLSRRYSRNVALAAALDNSIGDYVLALNARSDPAPMIPIFVNAAVSGNDVVIGQCSNAHRPPAARLLARAGRLVLRRILGTAPEPNSGTMYAFSRRVVNALTRIRRKSRFLLFDSAFVGHRRTLVPYRRVQRGSAPSHPSLVETILEHLEFLVGQSAMPLRIASLLGLAASFLNLLYLGYILAVVLVKDRVAEGWLTTSISHTLMFLFLFLMLTVLSEYIARILEETKDQPLYFVETESSSTVSCYDKQRLNVV